MISGRQVKEVVRICKIKNIFYLKIHVVEDEDRMATWIVP